VEDEPDWREALAAILEDANYQVLCAANGAEALRLLERYEGRCDVILLDLMMPVMNGWDFRRNQLRIPQLADIPVLLMSAGAHLAAAHDDLQAAGYLSKPVSADDVVEQLERMRPALRSAARWTASGR
jgi:CheY-like chemotaxis protein